MNYEPMNYDPLEPSDFMITHNEEEMLHLLRELSEEDQKAVTLKVYEIALKNIQK